MVAMRIIDFSAVPGGGGGDADADAGGADADGDGTPTTSPTPAPTSLPSDWALYIFGGRGGTAEQSSADVWYNDVWYARLPSPYMDESPDAVGVWEQSNAGENTTMNAAWSPRMGHAIMPEPMTATTGFAQKVYIVGGTDAYGNILNDVWSWSLNPSEPFVRDYTDEAYVNSPLLPLLLLLCFVAVYAATPAPLLLLLLLRPQPRVLLTCSHLASQVLPVRPPDQLSLRAGRPAAVLRDGPVAAVAAEQGDRADVGAAGGRRRGAAGAARSARTGGVRGR